MTRAVLIVDDHPLILDAFCMTLRSVAPDCRIDTASDFAQTRRLLESEADWDFVLLDLNLPDIDGFSALSTMRELRPDLQVVVISAQTDRETILRCIELGAHGYVPKTYASDKIRRALAMVAEGHIYVPRQLLGLPRTLAERDEARSGSDAMSALTASLIGNGSLRSSGGSVNGDAMAPGTPAYLAHSASAQRLGLTGRQTDVLRLILEGLPNKLICRRLDLAEGTVKVHVSAVLRALGVRNRTQAVIAANRLGVQTRD